MIATAAKRKGRGTKSDGQGMFGRGPESIAVGKLQKDPPQRIVRATVQPADIEVARIVPCEFQPRQSFPDEEIRELANSIAMHGQVHPIAVRPGLKADSYELVDGERRLRASKLLGLKAIRAEICEYSDAQVRAITLATALQRKELNAIEEAEAFRAAIAAGDAAGPSELAKQLGLSQGHVSNRLRLLELPAAIQSKVISREIPATHARSIARYSNSPAILQEIQESVKDELEWHGSLGPADDFDASVDRTAHSATRPATGTVYSSKLNKNIPVFTPTDEQRAQLELVEVSQCYMPKGQQKPELRAANTKLWEKLQAEHEAKLVDKAAARDAKKGTGKASGTRKPLSASEQKALDEAERSREKERAQKLAAGVWAVAIDWRRMLIAKACRERQVSPEDTLRILLYFAASRDWHRKTTFGLLMAIGRYDQRELALWNGMSDAGSRVSCKNGSPNLLAALRAFDDRAVIERALDFLEEMFWDTDERPNQIIPNEAVMAITEQLAIDLAAAWKEDAAGELTERWLNLRSKDALTDMARIAGVRPLDGVSKGDVVHLLNSNRKKIKPPAELLKPKKPRN